MQNRVIIHVIYSLGRGGAETMLVKVIKSLPEYQHVVITLDPDNRFGNELECTAYHCLRTPKPHQLPLAIWRLRKLINQYQPAIVHSHLFWPTIAARLATKRTIPLVTTIHAFIATSIEYKRGYIIWLDKITYKFRPSTIVAVAKGALEEYFQFLNLKPGKHHVLYTFADTKQFKISPQAEEKKASKVFKLVSLGALRTQKNQQLLIRAMHVLKDEPISLDIYGDGPLRSSLEALLKQYPANVNLMGEVKNIQNILPAYDLMVMSSTFEGFSLAVLEAMALQLPLLLSNIASFKEQAADASLYFNLTDEQQLVAQIRILQTNPALRKEMGQIAFQRLQNAFTLEHHLAGIRKIYLDELAAS
jgi:glycosyltransferase involved in cell wall biosynthesis